MKLFKNLTAICLCLLLLSCNFGKKNDDASSPPKGQSTEQANKPSLDPNKKPEFDIKFPEGWETQEGFMGTKVSAIAPEKDPQHNFGANLNVVEETLPTTMSLSAYFEASKNALKTMLKGTKVIEEGDIELAAGKGKFVTITHTHMGFPLKAKAYTIVHSKHAFVITGTSTIEGFDKVEATFDQAAKTFTLK